MLNSFLNTFNVYYYHNNNTRVASTLQIRVKIKFYWQEGKYLLYYEYRKLRWNSMIIKCYNEKHEYLLFIDVEFSDRKLVQFSGLLFKWIDDETYQLMRSCNQYVCTKVCYPFVEYTSITSNFLQENGTPLADVISFIKEDFLNNIPLKELEIISHGLRNDRLVLQENGLNLSTLEDGITPIDGYCTFNNAKRILRRKTNLTLTDIAKEAGYYIHNAHNAYNDTWAEVCVYTYLKKLEKQRQMLE